MSKLSREEVEEHFQHWNEVQQRCRCSDRGCEWEANIARELLEAWKLLEKVKDKGHVPNMLFYEIRGYLEDR